MISQRYSFARVLHGRVHYRRAKSSNHSENVNGVKCLCKYANISKSKAHHLSIKYPVINKLNEEKMTSMVNSLQEIGLSSEVLIKEPTLIGILPITIKHRYKVLKECGIKNISPKHLASYLTIIRQKTISELKKTHQIPDHINVENRLASYMTQWPTSLTTLIYEDINNSTLFVLRLKIIQRYLELVLDLTNEQFHRGIATYPTIKHRPLENINETLNILQSAIMIPNYKIKTNAYLIQADPENLKNILQYCRTIGGIDVKEVIRMHPKIAMKNYQTLLDIKKILSEYGISDEAQRRCFDIYTLSSDTIKERIESAKSIPEFSIFFNHPRFLKMIHYNKIAMKRLRNSYENSKKCVSLNILSGSLQHYQIFEKSPGDRLGKGKDLLFCISQSLGKKFSPTSIGNTIRRHPFWINTPALQVKNLYEQLSKQFTDDEIYANCQILLYPWKKVSESLNLLNSRSGLEQTPLFHEHFNFDALSNSQKLSLVLYLLEKNHYFSGNGVWTEERNRNPEKVHLQT